MKIIIWCAIDSCLETEFLPNVFFRIVAGDASPGAINAFQLFFVEGPGSFVRDALDLIAFLVHDSFQLEVDRCATREVWLCLIRSRVGAATGPHGDEPAGGSILQIHRPRLRCDDCPEDRKRL